jgi:lipid-A-disaccharide synthase-like uncharacterized protein
MVQKLLIQIADPWVIFGLAGQACFFLRFFIQWLASERAGQSVIPNMFWYLSIAGAAIVLLYGLVRIEPVLIVGQIPALAVYLRNIYFIHKRRQQTIVDPDAAPAVERVKS